MTLSDRSQRAIETPCQSPPAAAGLHERQRPRLRPGIGLDFQRPIVLPGDVQPAWHAHDAGGAIGFAGLARRFVLRGIPTVSDLTAGRDSAAPM